MVHAAPPHMEPDTLMHLVGPAKPYMEQGDGPADVDTRPQAMPRVWTFSSLKFDLTSRFSNPNDPERLTRCTKSTRVREVLGTHHPDCEIDDNHRTL